MGSLGASKTTTPARFEYKRSTDFAEGNIADIKSSIKTKNWLEDNALDDALSYFKERGYNNLIDRNEDGEIIFKASVTDKDTKERKVLTVSDTSLANLKKNLIGNGYSLRNNLALPTKLWDYVVDRTNANSFDISLMHKLSASLTKRRK